MNICAMPLEQAREFRVLFAKFGRIIINEEVQRADTGSKKDQSAIFLALISVRVAVPILGLERAITGPIRYGAQLVFIESAIFAPWRFGHEVLFHICRCFLHHGAACTVSFFSTAGYFLG